MFNLWKSSSKKDRRGKRAYSKSSKGGKAKFTPEEDQELIQLIEKYGTNNWSLVSSMMKGRNERQVKDRWFYYLSPDLNKSEWTQEEDNLLIAKVQELGSSWVKISKAFQGRTDVQIKNRWNILKRKMNAGTLIQETKEDINHETPVQNYEEASEPCVSQEDKNGKELPYVQYDVLEALFTNQEFFSTSLFDDTDFSFLL